MNVLTDRRFLAGIVVGLAVVYAYHHFVNPLPGTNKSPAAKRGMRPRKGG